MFKNLLKNTAKIIREMFCNLFNYGYQRHKHEVIGFYFVHTLLVVFIVGIITSIISVFTTGTSATEEEVLEKIQNIANIIVPVISGILVCTISALIVYAKKIYKERNAIITIIITVLLTVLLGIIVGCIPLTILTTYENKNNLNTEK